MAASSVDLETLFLLLAFSCINKSRASELCVPWLSVEVDGTERSRGLSEYRIVLLLSTGSMFSDSLTFSLRVTCANPFGVSQDLLIT